MHISSEQASIHFHFWCNRKSTLTISTSNLISHLMPEKILSLFFSQIQCFFSRQIQIERQRMVDELETNLICLQWRCGCVSHFQCTKHNLIWYYLSMETPSPITFWFGTIFFFCSLWRFPTRFQTVRYFSDRTRINNVINEIKIVSNVSIMRVRAISSTIIYF